MGANLTDGFDQFYKPPVEQERKAFKEGLIVLDANVLLHVMRYTPAARDELLGVIEAVADRCFVPHQIALEYNRNRVNVVSDRRKELDAFGTDIGEIQGKVRRLVNGLRSRRALPAEHLPPLEENVQRFFEALEAAAASAVDQYDLDASRLAGRVDEWTKRLETALAARVAQQPDDAVRAEDVKEATRRRELRLAPGFKDEAGGDYLWWAEVLRCDRLPGRPLVVVSDDAAKGDWRFEVQGIPAGPHAILTDDVKRAGGTDLVLLSTTDLLRLAGESGTIQVSTETIAESEKVLAEQRVPWTLGGYVALIRALAEEGYASRVSVIRAAARSGGHLDRAGVYEILGASEDDRSLRKFATPVQRIASGLVGLGVVSSHAEPALLADYDGPGKATGYSTPTEFTSFEKVLELTEHTIVSLNAPDWESRDQVLAHVRAATRRAVLAHEHVEDADEIVASLLAWAGSSRSQSGPAPVSEDLTSTD